MSRDMLSAKAFEEATWSRVLTQQAVAFGAFFAVVFLARLWTSFTSNRFLRRRHKNRTDTILALADIVCSTGSMISFIAQSILREYNTALTVIEVFFACFYSVAMIRRLWLKNFDVSVAFALPTFFDAYAVSIIAYQIMSGSPTWLTPTFMRSLSVLVRYEEVMKMGVWSSYGDEVKQRLVLSALRFLCVTFFFACFGFGLEILGDVRVDWTGDSGDTFQEVNANHDTTILDQIYFVVVTLSTVGYGDITPGTRLHQCFAIIMIVSGVAFFSGEVSAIVALRDEIDSGRGQYRRGRFRNSHIIVLGGAVTSGSATLEIFLEELLHPSRPNTSLPDVVLMSEEEPSAGLRRVLTSPLGQSHCKFIRGSPMDQTDLARADAANADMAFVLGNLSVMDHLTEAEDEDTILRASLLQRQLPGLPVRLLLLRSWAKDMARTAGINPLSCLTSGVLNYCRTALAVRCPGLPVLLTTMYSKLAGDWSQLPTQMMPWVREYFTSMRHDVYGAQVGAAYDGMPFLKAAALIYMNHNVNLLAVQSAPELGGKLCPAGLANGHLHILSEGDVVMCLGQDVQRVLRAVGSNAKHPEAWRRRFHAVRKAAAKMGTRREVFSPSISYDRTAAYARDTAMEGSVRGGHRVGHRRAGSKSNVEFEVDEDDFDDLEGSFRGGRRVHSHNVMAREKNLSRTVSGQGSHGAEGSSRPTPGGRRTLDHQATWRKGDMSDLKDQLVGAVSRGRRLEASKLESVSMKTRNLSALNFKLAAARAVQDAAKAVRKQREEGLDELGFTPWRTISRIAKTGGHIVVIVDGVLDQGRWSELEVLLYRLRGNDGSNIKPIVVVSKSPPAVQDLILWRSIDVFVTQGCVSDHEAAQALGFDRAHSIVLLADACSSDNPLLMDRRVLLATSVLEREDELTPDHMLPKMVLEFHHPKSVWHVQEARGFGSLESGLRKHICRKDGNSEGTRTSKRDHHDVRRGSVEISNPRNMGDMRLRRFSTDIPDAKLTDIAALKHAHQLESARPSLPPGWGTMAASASSDNLAGMAPSGPLRYVEEAARENTSRAKFLRGCLKFVGFLDRDGRRATRAHSNQYRASFQDQNRLSWVEHPESHTQYSRGNVMFRTEVSRVMATVFYTPGLMELVDSLTRDAHSGENIGHHPRIWSVPLPEHLHKKTMGEAFKYFSENEALVVGVYRNVKSAGAKKKRRTSVSSATSANSEGATVHGNESSDSAPSANGSSGGDDSGDDMASEEESEEELVDGKPRAKPEHDYVLTAPPHTVRLNPTDKLYVIATTDWAWVNVPEMVELRKTSAVICLQRQFRAKSDRRKEEEREVKLAEFPARKDSKLSEISYRKRRLPTSPSSATKGTPDKIQETEAEVEAE